MKIYTTDEMLKKIENNTDTQDCVMIIGSRCQRTYTLAYSDNEVWGSDPDGNFIDTNRQTFLNQYKDFKWSVQ